MDKSLRWANYVHSLNMNEVTCYYQGLECRMRFWIVRLMVKGKSDTIALEYTDSTTYFKTFNPIVLSSTILFYSPYKNTHTWGFPGGAVVENLPANAGDTGSSPGLGGSHMPRSSWAREPQLLSLRVWSLCPATGEAVTVRGPRTAMKSGPRSPQLEKALAQKLRPNTSTNK